MKTLALLPLIAAPLFMSACTTTVVERPPARGTVVVERGGYYHRPYRPYRRDVVVYEGGPRDVVYYNDHHGRYYWHGHRRVYVTVY